MLEIAAGGFDFVARFEEEAAPADGRRVPAAAAARVDGSSTCAGAARAAGFPSATSTSGIGPENATCYPNPGEIVFYPGGVSETEILLAYGYVSFASKAGPLAGQPLRDDRRGQREPARARPALPLGRRAGDRLHGALASASQRAASTSTQSASVLGLAPLLRRVADPAPPLRTKSIPQRTPAAASTPAS